MFCYVCDMTTIKELISSLATHHEKNYYLVITCACMLSIRLLWIKQLTRHQWGQNLEIS